MAKRLSEVAKEHDVAPSTIKFYIQRGLIVPQLRTPGGFYLLTPEDEARLNRIFELKQKRFTIDEIKEMLEGSVTSDKTGDA